MMYKNLREQLQNDISKLSQNDRNAQMEQLNKKIQDLEKSKKDRETREILQKQAVEQARGEKQKGFLSGIKSYTVEDI